VTTLAEWKRKALTIRCPRCGAQAGFSCRKATIQIKHLKNPHIERVNEVRSQEAS
jgi:uncharacterized C2H2 Zn-finger protein